MSELEVILSIDDTTFLDYDSIVSKRDGYGPIGKGGNGLILHSALGVNPADGQPKGLLWQKLWHREPRVQPPETETELEHKQRQKQARRQARQRAFADKESYRWVEALDQSRERIKGNTKVIHVFDREGDIAEVFEKARHLENTGVLVRATHDRSLDTQSERLCSKLEAPPVAFEQTIELPATAKRAARTAKIEVRFCEVCLKAPVRFDDQGPIQIYAVYAHEVDPPEGVTPLAWMLLTTEAVYCHEDAARILRWYTYRW